MCLECSLCCIVISIHALREEGDSSKSVSILATLYFYPRPPRGGRPSTTQPANSTENFYPRPPRGGRLPTSTSTRNPSRFLSTPSARRATRPVTALCPNNKISIHALREEGDFAASNSLYSSIDFYPRPPRGGRPGRCGRCRWWSRISIHALREEGDAALPMPCSRPISFLSTPSARRATYFDSNLYLRRIISIHALREEGDSKNRDKISIFKQIIQHSARI